MTTLAEVFSTTLLSANIDGSSIQYVHKEGGRGQAQVDGGGDQASCGHPHRKLKLESTGVIMYSSHAKKLASFFYQNFVFGRNKTWKFFGDIN